MTSNLSRVPAPENCTFESVRGALGAGAPIPARAERQFADPHQAGARGLDGGLNWFEELTQNGRLKAMTDLADQLEILKRIATFSASVRGHELGEWQRNEDGARASCTQCGAEVRVYFTVLQPEMDGPVLDHLCGERPAAEQAA